jgi:hypothetical protein
MPKNARRTQFTHEQRAVMTLLFNLGTTRPTRTERGQIACFSGLDPRVIQVWFQNERQRVRKTLMEELNAITRYAHASDSSSCNTTALSSSSPR